MSSPNVVYVYGNDWCGLYIDGKLARQGHSLSIYDLASALSIMITNKVVDESWLDEETLLPDKLEDVKEAASI